MGLIINSVADDHPTTHTYPVFLKSRNGLQNSENMSAAATAKSLQSCPTLCDPIEGSPPGSSVPGILQARILEWVAISCAKQIQLCNDWSIRISQVETLIGPNTELRLYIFRNFAYLYINKATCVWRLEKITVLLKEQICVMIHKHWKKNVDATQSTKQKERGRLDG